MPEYATGGPIQGPSRDNDSISVLLLSGCCLPGFDKLKRDDSLFERINQTPEES